MKKRKPSFRKIKKVTEDFNKLSGFVDIPIFGRIRDIKRYSGVSGFTLKEEILKNFQIDELLFTKIFCIEDKIFALNYHLSKIKKLTAEHKKVLTEFAKLFSETPSCMEVTIEHSSDKLRYEFEAFQFQFKACLDLLSYIIYHLYGDRRDKKSPFKKLRNELGNNLKNRYLADRIYRILSKKWINEFLSDDIKVSKRDKSAHFPWKLRYDFSELVSDGVNLKYTPIKEEGGIDLYVYCLDYYKKLNKTVESILGTVFKIE